jgi:hypothetical protein
MAKKFKPAKVVTSVAENYAKNTVTRKKRQQKIAGDTSLVPMERQLRIDADQRNVENGPRSVKSAVQFAAEAGATAPQIAGAYYKGAIKGAVKGAVQNIRGK